MEELGTEGGRQPYILQAVPTLCRGPVSPTPPGPSTSLQTLKIKQELELFSWNFLREIKKAMSKSTKSESLTFLFDLSDRNAAHQLYLGVKSTIFFF